MNKLSISEEKVMYDTTNFLTNVKEALAVFDGLPIEQVRDVIRSDEFKDEKQKIEASFWDFFSEISKHDDSLDSAIYLESFGFNLSKPVQDIMISLDSEEDEGEILL